VDKGKTDQVAKTFSDFANFIKGSPEALSASLRNHDFRIVFAYLYRVSCIQTGQDLINLFNRERQGKPHVRRRAGREPDRTTAVLVYIRDDVMKRRIYKCESSGSPREFPLSIEWLDRPKTQSG
tara:strand:- start:2 stop:373 length:372 start_codon:yes stop_codon:yes gene_type:complete